MRISLIRNDSNVVENLRKKNRVISVAKNQGFIILHFSGDDRGRLFRMSTIKRILRGLLVIVVFVLAIFYIGRYGWKLGGFRACESAGITSVEVSGNAVHITGFYPGSFPEGFCGYYSEERDGKLYVGFQFSAVFGIFETGDFDITIPIKGEIEEVIIKTSMNETAVWNVETGAIPQSEQYGVYIKMERSDVYYVSMTYDGLGGEISCTDDTVIESGDYCFMNNDIMIASKEAGAPVPFTVTIKDANKNVVASGDFYFDANIEKMYMTFTTEEKIEMAGEDLYMNYESMAEINKKVYCVE